MFYFFVYRTRYRIGLAALALLWGVVASAQTVDSYQVWTRLAARKQIANWEVTGDVNYRFQSNYLEQQHNPLAFPQTRLFRLTVSYQLPKGFMALVSPFLYAQGYRLQYTNNLPSEVEAVSQREFRWSAGGQKTFQFHALQWRLRLLGEYRHFPESTNRFRERLLVLGQYPVWQKEKKKVFALLFDELFYTSTPVSDFIYEQNRTFAGIYYQTGGLLEGQFGYQYTHQKQKQVIFHQSALLVYLIFRL